MNSVVLNNKFSGSLPFNKANFQVLEQERNLLKITLDYVAKENETLKGQIDDMRMTVKHNKELLKEYVDKITNKDKVVEKMSSTIEQLQSRIKSLEDHIKHLKSKHEKIHENKFETEKENKNHHMITSLKNENNNMILVNNTSKNTTSTGTYPNITINKSDRLNCANSRGNVIIEDVSNHSPNRTIYETNLNKSSLDIFKDKDQKIFKQEKYTKYTEFTARQNKITDELYMLKDDLQFLLDNRKKSKLKDKLDQSFVSNNTIEINDSTSRMNNSSFSIMSTNTIKRKYNIKKKFKFDNETYTKFQTFLNTYKQTKNILFLIDSKNNIWELIQRLDLNVNNFLDDVENTNSVVHMIKDNELILNRSKYKYTSQKSHLLCLEHQDSPKSKLLNIEIKQNDLSFDIHTELEISRLNDLNFSNLMRDIN